ncbi:MAG: transglycosylase SLT domain-containing protein, partial [Xanthomonadales bacterium]|nr:transglycosylase SLT domain-containing protein [Xanthomonadales bacterium]
VAFEADLGTNLFGRCLGPKDARGQLHVLLHPAVASDEFAVVLEFVSAELRRADGTAGLLTRPARILAERVVLPRLQDLRIDASGPLEAVDDIIETFDQTAPLLSERSRLAVVMAQDDGVAAEIALTLADPVPEEGPTAPLSPAELAEWSRIEDELDGFLTTVTLKLAEASADESLNLDLLGVLLDARLAIARALVDTPDAEEGAGETRGLMEEDPVRELFIETWDQLRPLVLALQREELGELARGLHLAAFMAGADAIAALDALGGDYDIEISRDGIRRLARLLLAEEAPARFTPLLLGPDPALRKLYGADEPPPLPTVDPPTTWIDWLIPAAHADVEVLYPPDWQLFVPGLSEREAVLRQVHDLLERKSNEHLAASPRIPAEVRPLFQPLVMATAWKESCWRHYITGEAPPEVIRSSIGAVGMMQINGRVWRGIYDLDRLEREIGYNAVAGIEILEHYLVDYALRRGEHLEPGGLENLPRATYAAYNGGPGQLSRYRRENTRARLKAIDRAFLEHFERIRAQGWPEVASCYAG